VNYLALLGWNDGTDKEVYSRQELIDRFDLSRVTASPAMFDDAKLRWLNGQHLRRMQLSDLLPLVVEHFRNAGLVPEDIDQSVRTSVDAFVTASASAAQVKAELITDIIDLARATLMYPLLETVALKDDNVDGSPLAKGISKVLDDDFTSFAHALLASYDAGEAPSFCYNATLAAEADATAVVNWLHDLGEALGRTKRRLLMPARLALTGKTTGIDVPSQLKIIQCATHSGCSTGVTVPLEERMKILRTYVSNAPRHPGSTSASISTSPSLNFDLVAFAKLRQVYEANRRTASDDAAMFKILRDAFDSP